MLHDNTDPDRPSREVAILKDGARWVAGAVPGPGGHGARPDRAAAPAVATVTAMCCLGVTAARKDVQAGFAFAFRIWY